MRYILAIISSTRLMAVLFVVFGLSIATATFIENDFGTDAARSVVYNAKWFEMLLFVGVINILGVIVKHKMYSRRKLTLLFFHLSFIVIIIGAGITRYFGHEGQMQIREGETSNQWYTYGTYLSITVQDQGKKYIKSFPVSFSSIGYKFIRKKMKLAGHTVKIHTLPSSYRSSHASSALRIKITCDGESETLLVFGQKKNIGSPVTATINNILISVSYGIHQRELPFYLKLNDFILKRYPGSESPSWFESNVQLIDPSKNINQERHIYMNHVLKYRGYRFYQSSYDPDEKGTILSLNRDRMGTSVTYLGYFLLALGMLLSLINRNSRFAKIAGYGNKLTSTVKIVFIGSMLMLSKNSFGDEISTLPDILPAIKKEVAADFGRILVQDNGGRIEPVNTLASEVLRKVSRKEQYKEQQPDQVLLGMWAYPDVWQHEKMIRIGHPEIRELLGIDTKYAAFIDFFSNDSYGSYVLHDLVENAYRKKPAYRSKLDNELIRVDERLNVCYLVYTGALFKFFPDPVDSTYRWHSPLTAGEVFSGKDSLFTRYILTYLAEELRHSQESNNYELLTEMIRAIKTLQGDYGKKIVLSETHIKAETFYNRSGLFGRITKIYLLVGLLLLLIQFIHFFIPKFNLKWFSIPAGVIIFGGFIVHTFTLVLRWYIAGHAPWSNGFEALTFIAWATVLAGLIFSRRSAITISSTAVLAALILQTAHLSWMDPQITNLVPVLQSYWLVIHVAVITASYGFLGLGALLATVNLLFMFFHSTRNYIRIDEQITRLSGIIEMTLIAGLYLLTIGTFLGGVWANESWGRYWGWDPKETWALVTIIVYAFILHLRLVSVLKGRVLFNITALIGFGSVIMTYFGVNYYLSGLHSYAQGDPLPVPPVIYYSITIVIVISTLAAFNQARLKKKKD